LSEYAKWFPLEQLKIVFSEHLLSDPVGTMHDIYRFLGVRDDHTPVNIGKLYHVGGTPRIPGLTKWLGRRIGRLKANRLGRDLLRRINAQALLFKIETQVNVKPATDHGPSEAERQLLTEYYGPDVGRLATLSRTVPPWSDFNVIPEREGDNDRFRGVQAGSEKSFQHEQLGHYRFRNT
jgi:hypothetical protein